MISAMMPVFLSSPLIGSVTHFPSSLTSVGYHVPIVIAILVFPENGSFLHFVGNGEYISNINLFF